MQFLIVNISDSQGVSDLSTFPRRAVSIMMAVLLLLLFAHSSPKWRRLTASLPAILGHDQSGTSSCLGAIPQASLSQPILMQ